MRLLFKLCCYGTLLLGMGAAWQELPPPQSIPPKEDRDRKLPNGKSQNAEILNADYQKSLKDAAELVDLSQALQKELESSSSHVLSIASLKKAEEIEKIAKRIHGRMRRF
jgi:hypothetical protein